MRNLKAVPLAIAAIVAAIWILRHEPEHLSRGGARTATLADHPAAADAGLGPRNGPFPAAKLRSLESSWILVIQQFLQWRQGALIGAQAD